MHEIASPNRDRRNAIFKGRLDGLVATLRPAKGIKPPAPGRRMLCPQKIVVRVFHFEVNHLQNNQSSNHPWSPLDRVRILLQATHEDERLSRTYSTPVPLIPRALRPSLLL